MFFCLFRSGSRLPHPVSGQALIPSFFSFVLSGHFTVSFLAFCSAGHVFFCCALAPTVNRPRTTTTRVVVRTRFMVEASEDRGFEEREVSGLYHKATEYGTEK